MFCSLIVWNIAGVVQRLWSPIFPRELSSSCCSSLTLSQFPWIFHAFLFFLFYPLSLFLQPEYLENHNSCPCLKLNYQLFSVFECAVWLTEESEVVAFLLWMAWSEPSLFLVWCIYNAAVTLKESLKSSVHKSLNVTSLHMLQNCQACLKIQYHFFPPLEYLQFADYISTTWGSFKCSPGLANVNKGNMTGHFIVF